MPEKVEKPKDPQSTPSQQVSEDTPADDSSQEARSAEQAELDNKFKNMESELGRLRQELGDERKRAEDLNAYKLWYEQNQQQIQYQQQQQQQQKDPNEMWFDNPHRMAQQQENRMMFQSAFQQAPIAKAMARMQRPEVFEGLTDAELDQAMYGGVQSGTTNPGMLSDPNAWAGAAWILQGQKSGYKLSSAPPANLPTTETESPSRPTPIEEQEIPSLKGDALTDRLIDEATKLGITKEEFLKEVQETRGEVD